MLRKIALLLTVTALMLLGGASFALAGSQDFRLVNRTGVDIHELYIAPSGSQDWEEDVLGQDVLADGDELAISFDSGSERYWDLLIRDGDGNSITWEKINLKEISKLTLHYDGQKAWADFD